MCSRAFPLTNLRTHCWPNRSAKLTSESTLATARWQRLATPRLAFRHPTSLP